MREAIKKFFSLRLEFGTLIMLRGELYDKLQEAREEHIKQEISYAMNKGAYDRCLELGLDSRDRNRCNAWASNMRDSERACVKAKAKYDELLAAYRDFEDANDKRKEVE